jgi:TP53 regulating kinase-like protein
MSISVSSMSISSTSNNVPQPLPPIFTPQEDWTLISQGAEARIWKIPSFTATAMNSADSNTLHKNKKRKGADEESISVASEETSPPTPSTPSKIAVAKERFTKSYRHAILDERLTKHRCRAEARILEKCLHKGDMDVPRVYQIQGPVLYLEYIEGVTVRDYLLSLHTDNTSDSNNLEKKHAEHMAHHIGTTVGKLHSLGVVHGDLTTSNMMIRDENLDISHTPGDGHIIQNLTLIDFGLGKNTASAEERAVDLYVLERALLSTHPTLPETFWNVVTMAYEAAASAASAHDKKGCQATMTRLELVRQRGRKRECFG